MLVAPTTAASLYVDYYSAPTLGTTGASTNVLLTAYPEPYLYYVLMLANLYIQNGEQATTFAGLYADLKNDANRAYQQRQQPVGLALPNTVPLRVAV